MQQKIQNQSCHLLHHAMIMHPCLQCSPYAYASRAMVTPGSVCCLSMPRLVGCRERDMMQGTKSSQADVFGSCGGYVGVGLVPSTHSGGQRRRAHTTSKALQRFDFDLHVMLRTPDSQPVISSSTFFSLAYLSSAHNWAACCTCGVRLLDLRS